MNSYSREMGNVARLFMSSGDDAKDIESIQSNIKELPLNNKKENVEIEENVSIRKRFAYPNDPNAQSNMLLRLQTLVKQGYNIWRIELKKKTNIKNPGRKETLDEQVILFRKEPEAE